MGELSEYTDTRNPEAIKANNKDVDVFFAEMSKNGFNISSTYYSTLKALSEVSIYNCSKDSQTEIFRVPEGATKEEKQAIAELQETLIPSSNLSTDFSRNTRNIRDEKESAFNKFLTTVICDSIIRSQEKTTIQQTSLAEK